MRSRRPTTWMLLIATIAVWGCDRPERTRSATNLLDELRQQAPYQRHFAARLSIATTYQACPDSNSAGIIRIGSCHRDAEPPSASTLAFAARTAAALKASSDPKTLHAAALVELLWSDEEGTSLDRSISLLSAAARRSEDADALADLAAAHLVRAERSQTPRDIVEAIEVASRALRISPSHAAARFNLALALDRVGLVAEAQKEWQRYLSVDSTSEWAGESRLRRRELPSGIDDRITALAADGDSVAATRFAESDAGSARVFGWDNLLGTWAEAALASDSIRANRTLRAARLLGQAIERSGGDASLADAVGVIARATDKSAIHDLAIGHRAYSAGRAAYTSLRYDAAAAELRTSSAAPQPVPLRQWSNVFLGGALIYQRRLSDGQDLLRSVVTTADTSRHPALAARAAWSLGLTMVRAGSYADGVSLLRRAESWFDHAGEHESRGAVAEIQAEVLFDRGDTDRGFDALQVALTMLGPYAKSVWHHNALWTGARESARAGLPNAAARFAAEDARVAQATGLAAQVVESRLTRARLLLAAGDRVAADSEFGVAQLALNQIPRGVRGWLEADLGASRAAEIVGEQPEDAISQLDSVIQYFGTTQQHPVRLFPALVARAEALIALGDTGRATHDLTRAIEVVEARRDSFADLPDRTALLDAARPTFDRIVRLRLAAGKSGEALALLERSRSALQRLTPSGGSTDWSLPIVSRAGQTIVDFGLIGDTLVTWIVNGSVIRTEKQHVDRALLRETTERVRTALELESQNSESLEDLSRLYDLLIGPVVGRLTSGETLVIVPDAELANVPFAALRNRASGQFLIETYPIRVATDLRDAIAARKRHDVVKRALIIADPAFDAKAFRGLHRLRGAEREAQAIGKTYQDFTTLAGSAATTSATIDAMRKFGVVHYAGHAVFNDERPERSMLALARDSADAPVGLAAEAIARLDLGNLRLVVLSACETIRGRSTPTGGFTGLAAAFRNAGADGVIGSLWRVDDEATAALMADFHREYAALGDPVAALRAAQLQYIKTAMGARASPFAWAAFRYVGT